MTFFEYWCEWNGQRGIFTEVLVNALCFSWLVVKVLQTLNGDGIGNSIFSYRCHQLVSPLHWLLVWVRLSIQTCNSTGLMISDERSSSNWRPFKSIIFRLYILEDMHKVAIIPSNRFRIDVLGSSRRQPGTSLTCEQVQINLWSLSPGLTPLNITASCINNIFSFVSKEMLHRSMVAPIWPPMKQLYRWHV